MRWNDTSNWIFSETLAHQPIIAREAFEQSNALRAIRRTGRGPRKRSTPRPYVLRGLLHCATCGRRKQGQWNNNAPYYRCRYPAEYALTNGVDHPRTVYIRQDQIMPPLDAWLSTIFDPANIDETCSLLAAAAAADQPAASGAQQAALAKLAHCDGRLAQYRKALDSGADPSVVTRWISDVQTERGNAERVLAAQRAVDPLSTTDIRRMVESIDDTLRMLGDADPKTKATLYASLGITLTYEHERRIVHVEARPGASCAYDRVGGSSQPIHTCAIRGKLSLA